MFDTLPYVNFGEVKIEPESMIVLYTDGLSEAANNEGKLFEVEGLVAYLEGHSTLELKDFNTQLLDTVIAYKQDTDFDDDITLLTLRIK